MAISKIEVECANCGELVLKVLSEYRRSLKLGRRVFCSLSCTAKKANEVRKSKALTLKCPHCGNIFQSSTHNKAPLFCSRSCASAGSMSPERRAAQREGGRMAMSNLSTEASLKSREAWKYAACKDLLEKRGLDFEFEFEIEGRVFDLALMGPKVIVEFDGPYHSRLAQQEDDLLKETKAHRAGFAVVRVKTSAAEAINPKLLEEVLGRTELCSSR